MIAAAAAASSIAAEAKFSIAVAVAISIESPYQLPLNPPSFFSIAVDGREPQLPA
jgi:hypothetical protein